MHANMKRHQLFLAPHRRNLVKSGNSSGEGYVEAMKANSFMMRKDNVDVARDNVKIDNNSNNNGNNNISTNGNNNNISTNSNNNNDSNINGNTRAESPQNSNKNISGAADTATNNTTNSTTDATRDNIISENMMPINTTSLSDTSDITPQTTTTSNTTSSGNITSGNATSPGNATSLRQNIVTLNVAYKRHQLVFKKFFSKPGALDDERIVRTYKLFSRR